MSTLLSNSAVEELRACLMQPERLLLGTEDCLAYSYDNSKRSVMPQGVALCVNAKEVADLLRVCHERAIPVTAQRPRYQHHWRQCSDCGRFGDLAGAHAAHHRNQYG